MERSQFSYRPGNRKPRRNLDDEESVQQGIVGGVQPSLAFTFHFFVQPSVLVE
jgi:hypothetical protein